MTALASAFAILGAATLWLDLGNRLFGSYARNPVGALARIALIVAVIVGISSPLVWLWIDPASRVALYTSGFLGAISFVHFLIPYRWGIRRPANPPPVSERPLVAGVCLRNFTLELPGLSDAARELTCLVLSDFHCNTQRQLTLIRNAVDLLEKEPVDLVFLLGDFGENQSLLPEVIAAVSSLPGRFGTYCVLGNHDYEGGRQTLVERLLRERSVRVLTDEFVELPQFGIAILGLAYPWSGCSVRPARRSGFVLALTHTPDNLPYLDRLGVPLAFAGHTHGGKVRLPAIGAVLVPSKLGRFLDEGWFQRGGTLRYLTRGFGYFPGRFGNVAEICRFTLRRRLP